MAVVVGVDSYKHASGVYQTSGSGESASEALKRRSMSFMASSYIPAVANTLQTGNLLHAAGPNGGGADLRGDSVAAMWNGGMEIVRDPYSVASVGIRMTWISMWDLEAAFRLPAYSRISFQVS